MSWLQNNKTPIAIVGTSCRLPGQSSTPSKLYELLKEPRDVRQPLDRFNLKRFYDANPDALGSTNVKKHGHLLMEDPRVFDASFFSVSPYEAESMDPQLRITLEAVYEAFESAGWTLDMIRGSQTSVHVGVMASDYYDIQVRDPEMTPLYAATGTHRSTLSNRISYAFDLHGPSVTLDTACSSSLVALHQAVRGLQAGDAECAVVGGVNLIFDPMLYIMLSNLHMLSPDAQSRMWDRTVNGYARGEGVAVVVLKPLDKALRDNDHIEAIIRGTGVNSDGASPGLTMPTVKAQAALIRDTYLRAGLDPVKDRCQFFECHGTGTPAGDPVEAGAIYEAMISPQGSALAEAPTGEPMYVGSIKTVVGHLEGGAGLAGVLKALLSIKHKTIFPNLLFNELNPKIAPFYGQLQIPRTALPWPDLPAGQPLRASVNNFGFGGTNAHAILESYEANDQDAHASIEISNEKIVPAGRLAPFLVSGHTSSSLVGNCQSLLQYLSDNPHVRLQDLNWVLRSRRTAHPLRTHFRGQNREELMGNLANFISMYHKATVRDDVGIRSRQLDPSQPSRKLAVFTGQGAQWPTMGRALCETSPLFRDILKQCETVLKELPDGPEWSLLAELWKEAPVSRIAAAVISQPLCTAIQLGLVELLRYSGIVPDVVIGHSSGEIAAAYASGVINITAAMQIAYYRGKHAHLACGPNGQAGGMMAVGITYDEAKRFCAQPEYRDRIGVAAVNAPASVTLSGNLDAIKQAKVFFVAENIFARELKVDTAYHSNHMEKCVSEYLQSLMSCNIEVKPPRSDCTWVSSVHGNDKRLHTDRESLKGPYWVANMVQPVLFAPAVQYATETESIFDMVIEVGPHPALKGPTTQILQAKSETSFSVPYIATLQRDRNDTDSVTDTVGLVWCHLGPGSVSFDGFERTFSPAGSPNLSKVKMIKDLPPYAWDHDRIYWRESRISKNFRTADNVRHPLLGRRAPDDTEREMRWRNVLRLADLPWTQGHAIAGEILLPGTSYITMCTEAARILAKAESIKLIEVLDLSIRRPVIIPDTREGLEVAFTVHLNENRVSDRLEFAFCYYYADADGSMEPACHGKAVVHLGDGEVDGLPRALDALPGLYPVDSEDGYESFARNGLVYTGVFRKLYDVYRKRDYAVANATWPIQELGTPTYHLHPAVLDVAWQNMFHARSDPAVGALSTTILPVSIKRVVVDPNVPLEHDQSVGVKVEAFSTLRNGLGMIGDVHVYSSQSGQMAVQMESVTLEAVSPQMPEHDRSIFFKTTFMKDPCLNLMHPPEYNPNSSESQRTKEHAADIERVCLFYIRQILQDISQVERHDLTWYHQKLVRAWEASVQLVRDGSHPVAETAWLDDTSGILDSILSKWPNTVDLDLIRAVGEKYPEFLRRKEALLEVIMKDNMAGRMYSEGCGFTDVNGGMVGVLQQISHKFPQAKFLEIGAGTGSTTEYVLQATGASLDTYTYTDISPAFFEQAAARFSNFRGKMIFKTLDVESELEPQGYQKHSYDVVVASNVLHATASIKRTLENARSLLKPGGFLLLVEITGTQMMRTTFCVGGLPGWWLGTKEGRELHPGLTTEEWHATLQDTGYSGVDLVMHDVPGQHCLSFIASQAVDSTVQRLREPLDYVSEVPELNSLLLIGGKTLTGSKIMTSIQRILGSTWKSRVTIVSEIEAIDFARIGSGAQVLCLQELDGPVSSTTLSNARLNALKKLFVVSGAVLWVTPNRRVGNPASNIVSGMAGAISKELPQLSLQLLDIDSISSPSLTARTVLEAFLRLIILSARDTASSILWPREPELVSKDGDTLVPRVMPDHARNAGYNSRFRAIARDASPSDTCIGMIEKRGKLSLVECSPSNFLEETSHRQHIQVHHSIYIPGGTTEKTYLSVGKQLGSEEYVAVVARQNTSIIAVAQDAVTPIHESDCTAAMLEHLANNIITFGLLSLLNKDCAVLFYEADEQTVDFVSVEARKRCITPLFASSRGVGKSQGCITVHPQSSSRMLRNLIPRHVSAFMDYSSISASRLIPASLEAALPSGCAKYQWQSDLFHHGLQHATSVQKSLKIIHEQLSKRLAPSVRSLTVVDPRNAPSIRADVLERAHITSWDSTDCHRLVVQPPDASVLFHPHKTYLMIGMAQGLGLSICEWAIQQGARHLLIASRNPELHPEWMTWAHNMGAKIHVKALDAADRSALESCIVFIQGNLPPLGGVCNAAMVLSDRLFVDMDEKCLNAALKPKVDVARHLDDILGDTPLDFFILLSSALSITGSHGQANYHAANMFMTALAANRRDKGRAGSVIHIGYVCDVGYFTRAERSSKEYVSRMHFGPISCADVHHAFAEAILASSPDSERGWEVGIGLEPLSSSPNEEIETAWSSDPRFSHFLPTVDVSRAEDCLVGQEDIMTQIREAETEADARTLVQEALISRLESLLQLPAGSIDADALLAKLGIDSLVAVELRAWFLNKFAVDIPVVKILGRNAVRQLCEEATKEILKTLGEKSAKRSLEPTVESADEAVDVVEADQMSKNSSSSGHMTPVTPVTPVDTESDVSISAIQESLDKSSAVEAGDEKRALVNPVDAATTSSCLDLHRGAVSAEPMSAAQSRIFLLGQLMDDPTAYSLMIRYDLEDHLDVQRLQNALTRVMQHHECLRTCFFARHQDNRPTQGLLPFPIRRFRHVENATDEDIVSELQLSRAKVWDIENGETLSLTVLSRTEKSHILVLAYHHIIFDATGMRRFMQDLNMAYNMRPLKSSGGTCIQLAKEESQKEHSEKLLSNMQYWRQEFSSLPEPMPPLPMSKTTMRSDTRRVATCHAEGVIDEATVKASKTACQTLGITPFQLHLAVVQVLISRLLGTQDVCIGVADANRPSTRYMETVGFFLNLLPVCFHTPANSTFEQVAINTATKVSKALEKAVPFDTLLDQLNVPRSTSYTPLFQVLVNYRLAMTKEVPFGNASLVITDSEEGRNPYDITFSFLESQSGQLGVTLDCSEALYDASAAQQLVGMYLTTLKSLVGNIGSKVDDCQIYERQAIAAALAVGKGQTPDFGEECSTVAMKFAEISQVHPERIATSFKSSDLTYKQLQVKVHSIAAGILSMGHGAGARIGVLCEPSNDFVASMMAIFYVGAVYVPLDISLPAARHADMLSNCDPDILVYHDATRDIAVDLLKNLGDVDAMDLEGVKLVADGVPCAAAPDAPACLLYTSGTTGTPKGVVLSQGGMANWLAHTLKEHNLAAEPLSILQQSSLGFDMSLIQILTAICSGGTLVTAPTELRRDPVLLTELMREKNITFTFAVPSECLLWLRHGRSALRDCKNLRWLFMGGESVPPEVVHGFDSLQLPHLSLVNCYGPTETTFTSTSTAVSLDSIQGNVIGKPHSNYSVCILDSHLCPVPLGFRGEICIGGSGVGLGYWKMPAATKDRFILDPTATATSESGRWYRSGDQGYLTSDGRVIFLGRIAGDNQVKLRGLRIELEEVEGALLRAGQFLLSAAVVTVREGDLIAHVILVPGKQIDQSTVQKKLLSNLKLPQYMHPARVIVVSELPRTNTGKMDRQAIARLPLASSGAVGSDAPNELSLRQVELKLLWSKVLPDPYQILTADSEFFLEGGNSLRLTQLQHEIEESLGVFLSTRELYSAPTLRQMAALVDMQRGEQTGNDEEINWQDEIAIPDNLIALAKHKSRSPRNPDMNNLKIAMTGSTGVLGNSILHGLLQNAAVAQVHCIAVLPEEEYRLPASDKIICYTGSLASPALGLSTSECEGLQAQMDVVIHAGGNGHCLNSYYSVRRPNVESTHFLASLCVPYAVPLLYVSSQRVPALQGLKSLGPVPVLAEPGKTGDTGYMASRWVSERFLHNFAELSGLVAEIHRPCLFYGERAPTSDALNGVLTFTRRIKAVPHFRRVEGYIDFKHVDIIGADIVSAAIALAAEKAQTGVRYRHHSSGRKVPFDQWTAYMTELTGEAFELLELPEWIVKAKAAGMDPLIGTYLEGVFEKEELGLFPYLGESLVE